MIDEASLFLRLGSMLLRSRASLCFSLWWYNSLKHVGTDVVICLIGMKSHYWLWTSGTLLKYPADCETWDDLFGLFQYMWSAFVFTNFHVVVATACCLLVLSCDQNKLKLISSSSPRLPVLPRSFPISSSPVNTAVADQSCISAPPCSTSPLRAEMAT